MEEIIIQTKTIGNAAIPTDENGRVWIYYGESDSIKGENSRYYVSASDIIKGELVREITRKTWYSWDLSNWIKRYKANTN